MLVLLTFVAVIILASLSGVALMMGLHALMQKCEYRALKIGSAVVALSSAVFIGGIYPTHIDEPSSAVSGFWMAVILVSVGFFAILSVAGGKRSTSKSSSYSAVIVER